MNHQNKCILLTGGSGFLGRHILSAFEDSGYTVYTIGRKRLTRSNHIIADVLSQTVTLPDIKFHSIVHVAGKAHSYPKTKSEKDQYLSINYQGTKNVCSWIDSMKTPPDNFIFISSVAVYGLEEGENISENANPNPISVYGESKLKAENVIANWANENQIPYLSLRLPLIAGKNAPGNLGKMYNTISRGLYPKILGNHNQKSMVLAQDVARLIVNYNGKNSGEYNLTDGYHPSFHEIEKAIEINTGKRIRIKIPLYIIKPLSKIGDLLSTVLKREFPLTTFKLKKITSTLTFDDLKARKEIGWDSNSVLHFIENEM